MSDKLEPGQVTLKHIDKKSDCGKYYETPWGLMPTGQEEARLMVEHLSRATKQKKRKMQLNLRKNLYALYVTKKWLAEMRKIIKKGHDWYDFIIDDRNFIMVDYIDEKGNEVLADDELVKTETVLRLDKKEGNFLCVEKEKE